MRKQPVDYNNIREWLIPKLDAMQISIEMFARQVGVSRAVVYFYLNDTNRPSEEVMYKMCEVLGVPFEEGLRQYTPKIEGRPVGFSPNGELSVRRKR